MRQVSPQRPVSTCTLWLTFCLLPFKYPFLAKPLDMTQQHKDLLQEQVPVVWNQSDVVCTSYYTFHI